MTDNFNYLFKYLQKKNITIDKPEFQFQIQSHPSYPSLLSIADTLSFFNIDNIATRIAKEQLDDLPNIFIALLYEKLNDCSAKSPDFVDAFLSLRLNIHTDISVLCLDLG